MSSKQKIDALRTQIAAAAAAREDAALTPVSRAELGVALDRALDADAVRVAERGLAARVTGADYDEGTLFARVQPDGRVNLLPALVALFGRDTVRRMLDRYITEATDGPTAAERRAALATHDADLLRLERAEEREIRALEAAGVEVIRRGAANPRAVLADLS